MQKKTYNVAIIVAAGSSTRFGEGIPKQYIDIEGISPLTLCIRRFQEHEDIDQVLVVINKGHEQHYKAATEGISNVDFVFGGDTRQDSVRNALLYLQKYPPKNVLIHDAARIFLESSVISEMLDVLSAAKAVIAAAPVNDTIKLCKDGFVDRTLDRSCLFSAQTPQGFDYNTILDLHNKNQGQNFTDDALICEKGAVPVKVVISNFGNFKITTKEDVELAKKIMRGQNGV